MRRRPEHDGTYRVESQAHQDSDFVAFALEDLGSDGSIAEVASAEVHDLQAGRLEFGDAEDGLEMLVEDIEKAV